MGDHGSHAHGPGAGSHAPVGTGRARALWWALAANSVLLVAQIVGGLVLGSLALLADSAHQASDIVGLAVALVALRLSERPRTATYTYGLRRTETLGALGNAMLLLVTAGWILVEAVRRLGETGHVDGGGVVVLALVGLAVNAGSAVAVSRVAGASLNLRGAFLHLLYDAIGSVGVLVAGLAVVVWGADWVDPAVSVGLGVLVGWSGLRLLGSTTRVLLEGAPVDTDHLVDALTENPRVLDVHHLHVWSLDSEHAALSAHVVVDEPTLHAAQHVGDELQGMLRDRFAIGHATLALECHVCDDAEHALPGGESSDR